MKGPLAGHGLQYEGRPVLKDGCCGSADSHGSRNYYDRLGHGLCACGAMSLCETTTAARQCWHRQHKDNVRSSAP